MSDAGDNSGEKSFEPSSQKLETARRKGDIPRSMDVSAAAVVFGLYLALALAGHNILNRLFLTMRRFLSDPDAIAAAMPGAGSGALFGTLSKELLASVGLLVGLPFLAAIVAFGTQRAIVFSPQKLLPKLSKISPIANAKNKFGPSGLVQFLKSLTKAAAVSVTLLYFLNQRWEEILGLSNARPLQIISVIGESLLSLILLAVLIFGLIALFDLLWQRYQHTQKLRMTHQEVRDEQKQSEGDPHLKAERRQKGQELATNRMLLDVPNADVVLVNPTHFAVALAWSRKSGEAPMCLAKGQDEIALKIREIAEKANVPVYRDPETARALFSSIDVGAEIHPDNYKAVAVAIRFAEKILSKARPHK